jgi:SAM-dependent methyltransferase
MLDHIYSILQEFATFQSFEPIIVLANLTQTFILERTDKGESMKRSYKPELLDSKKLSAETLTMVHNNLAWTNRILGNTQAITRLLKQGPKPNLVLDIGCGNGSLLQEIKTTLGVRVCGIELDPANKTFPGIPLEIADATRDPLPHADVAIALLVAHHLTETELQNMIRNVGKYTKRFIILDVVRSALPLWLFRLFIAPFVHAINAQDGMQSVRRAYTPEEINQIVGQTLRGTGSAFRHTTTLFKTRQIVDITYGL